MALNLSGLPRGDIKVHLIDKKPDNYFDDELNVYVDGLLPSGDVTQLYVDQKDAETLAQAKAYTDEEIAKATVTKLYTDFGDNEDGSVTQKFFTEQFNLLNGKIPTIANLTTPGLVLSDDVDGNIAVSDTGRMTVNGWSDLKKMVETDNRKVGNLPEQVFYNTSLTAYNSENVELTLILKDLHTGGDAFKTLPINGATNVSAGVMTKDQVITLEQMVNDVEIITKDIENLNKDIDTKQDRLVDSGENQNLKTINGESLLGTGNIEITGGGNDPRLTDQGATYANNLPDYVLRGFNPIETTADNQLKLSILGQNLDGSGTMTTSCTIPLATTTATGLMSANDKSKLSRVPQTVVSATGIRQTSDDKKTSILVKYKNVLTGEAYDDVVEIPVVSSQYNGLITPDQNTKLSDLAYIKSIGTGLALNSGELTADATEPETMTEDEFNQAWAMA